VGVGCKIDVRQQQGDRRGPLSTSKRASSDGATKAKASVPSPCKRIHVKPEEKNQIKSTMQNTERSEQVQTNAQSFAGIHRALSSSKGAAIVSTRHTKVEGRTEMKAKFKGCRRSRRMHENKGCCKIHSRTTIATKRVC
jgi:hypothetical protein